MVMRATGISVSDGKSKPVEIYRYVHHERFSLPRLQRCGKDRTQTLGSEKRKLASYRLVWPGEGYTEDLIPAAELPWISGRHPDHTLSIWARDHEAQRNPDEWPQWLRYHAAVNHDVVKKTISKIHVGPLPHKVVQAVLKTEFAISEDYLSTIEHLQWLATSMHHDPDLNRPFDTMIRDSLYRITAEIVRQFFFMLGDCIWDEGASKWMKNEFRYQWDLLAGYLWWYGRAGIGIVPVLAGADDRGMALDEAPTPAPHAVPLWDELFKEKRESTLRLRPAISRLMFEYCAWMLERTPVDKDGRVLKRAASKKRSFVIDNPS